MKNIGLLLVSLLLTEFTLAQEKVITPDLSKVKDSTIWALHGRNIIDIDPLHLSKGEEEDGLLWLKNFDFTNGTIEFDVKGRDVRGESFVGLALHGVDRSRFDVIYFRPFNFKSEEKKNNAIQYVSLPDFTWRKLREEHPGVYENAVTPVPDPEGWVHTKIVVNYPTIKVFLENSDVPTLVVDQLSKQKKGWIGFWVGSYSEGEFKNLKIIK